MIPALTSLLLAVKSNDDLDLDKSRLAKKSQIDCTVPSHPGSEPVPQAQSADGRPAIVLDTVTAQLNATRANSLTTSRHFPHILSDDHKTQCRTRLKGNLSVNDVVMRVNLGFARFQMELEKVSAIRCLLQWIEPFLWALL